MTSTLPKKIIIGVLLLGVLGLSAYTMQYVKKNYRHELLGNVVVQRMIPTYRSLRKLPDLVFMPWSTFAQSNLDTYELTISPQDIERMNALLPPSPFLVVMEAENKLWVSAYFRTKDYEGNVKVKYRGNQPTHWNAFQKSYSIKFPKDNLFQGKQRMTLVIPSDRRYLDMSLNDYRAEKLGLIHPSEYLVNLEVNGSKKGVLYAFEGWSQPWIEKMPISSLSTIYGVDEGHTPYKDRWNSWNAEEPIDLDPLTTLEEIISHASDEEFERLIPLIIDIEDWYAWDTMRILAAGYHGDSENAFGGNNLVMIFDRAEVRFKPVPYNVINYTPSHRALTGNPTFSGPPDHLLKRILSIPEFRARRDEVFAEYVKNEKEADIAYLEEWKETYNREFLLDNAKNDNHFMYLNKVDESIEAAIRHFDDPFGMIQATYTAPVETKESLKFPKTFSHLKAAGVETITAAKQHPSLLLEDGELLITAGVHTFLETIIIPKDTKLTISPGTTLLMEENVSFVSYSPVDAKGTKEQPIKILGVTKNTDWGVFAIINTGRASSTLSYIEASNGGEATINGAYISGTIALHNANGNISNTTVMQARGDDGINIKGSLVDITNSIMENNSSDGVDLDYIHENSIFSFNELRNNAGDALDISWSDLTISKNVIDGCVDKGISVGESSKPTITDNVISNCDIGIAIKDSSIATATGNTISNTETAFSLFNKKPYFSGGTLIAINNELVDNSRTTFTDSLSVVETFENNSTSTSQKSN